MRASDMPARVMNVISAGRLFPARASILVGCSGGPDSVALLDILQTLNRRRSQGWRLTVAHLNHMLRGPESEEDARFVHELAASYGLPFALGRKRVKSVARSRHLSIEEAAREVRYQFFAEAAEQTGSGIVVTGHTADDNAETILHHVLRGTGLRGLAGMPIKRSLSAGSTILLVRPLLHLSRADIREYLTWRRLPFRVDASNLDISYRRNRIRHELIPYLEREFNPRVRQALLRLGAVADAAEEFLMGQISTGRGRDEHEPPGLSVAALVGMPRALREMVLRDAISACGIAPSHGHIADVARLVRKTSNHGSVELPGGIIAEKKGDRLTIGAGAPRRRTPEPFRRELPIPGKALISALGTTVRAELIAPDEAGRELERHTRYHEVVDLDRVLPPLAVRSRRTGDEFRPLGMTGRKKLSDYFIDRKVPRAARDLTPLVVDRAGIVWVVGWTIADRVKVRQGSSRFMRLSATRTRSENAARRPYPP